MIYVGSRDGRKRLGSGLEMAETELEEGEALSYHDEDEDSTIDPDIALSYIEEKLQNVLGHFQKDFEGGVSAENLGAKYGGYGSFLPAYQRSPSWSHTKSPAEGHNYASPRKTLLEDQKQNGLSALSSASPLARPRPGPGKAVSVSRHAEESSLKNEANKKPANSADQRTLKVRIRVGSENLPTQKNAEIYSGLGLEVSPSSSLDDSPTTSGGQYGKFLNVPEESPTSILQIMTSYPKEILLSPLSEDLIHLTEKKKLRGKWETKPVNLMSLESSGMLTNGSFPSRRNQKNPDQKKMKSSDKDDVFSTELTDKKNNSHKDNPVPLSKKEKETDIDSLACEELVSSALRLPLLSNSEHNVGDHAKDVSNSLNAPSNSSFFEKEHLDGDYAQEIGRVEMLGEKLSSSGKFPESKKGNLVSSTAENFYSLDQSESNVSKGRKFLTSSEPNDLSKLLDTRKVGSVNEEGPSKSTHEKSSSSKRKQKIAKDELAVESSLTPKTGKLSLTHNSVVSKNDSRNLQKDNGRPLDRYKDFFGDVEFDDDDNESISGEMTSSERVKDPQFVGKRSLNEDHEEKCNSKIPEKPLPAARPASHLAPPGNGPSSEAPIGSVPLLKEDWVSCDKCQKWRLLPLGTNPKSLPDKWLCRMLNWLPGMNRCSVPEEQTTNALRAMYNPGPGPAPASVPAPVSESQPINISNSVANSVGIASVNTRYPGPEQQNTSVQTATNGGKKKHGSTKAANSTELDGSTHSSNSKKKHLFSSGKISNLNCEDYSPSLDASLRQSNDAVERYNDSKKDKVSAVNSSDKGTSLKIKSMREADMDGSRSSKRIRSEELNFNDENCASDNGETLSKVGRPSTSNNTSGNDRGRKYKQKDLRGEAKKNIISDDGLIRSEKVDDKEAGKKRKAKEEMCESDHRKEKRARVSKSGGKDTSGSKASLGEDRKGRSIKDQHNNEKEDYMKSEMGPIQPSVAANSSSSKVSGSHKNKTSGQEVKGSPVESVSSSPLRFPNADKVASVRKNLDGSNDRKGMVKKEDDPRVKHSLEQSKVQEKTNTDQKSQNSGKKSSHSKEKGRLSGSEIDKLNIKASDTVDHDNMYEEKSKSRRNKSEEKKPSTPSNGENFISKNDIAGGTSSESSKGQSQKKSEDPIKSHDKKYNLQQEHENEKLHKKSNQGEIHDNGKSHSLPPLARNQNESVSSLKENGFVDNGDALKAPNQRKKAESSNGQLLRHPTPNTHRVRDAEAPSPVRRDSSSHAANNALKEAKDLKHLADRLKNSGSSDSNGLYFQAALKFLHGASLLESGSSEATKHNELMHSMHIYRTTAKLCEFCAHEYEKSKDMGAAALAYKCVEVAYMRVVYSSHASASRDRNELQRALQIVPPGESPSSSASDVDNLNHQATTEKVALPKVVGSPQVSGSHVITSRHRSGFLHVLNFAQDVNFAMEASRKSRNAFTTATSKLGETSHKEGISQLKKALDFNFQDVEGLLHLVRIAMDAINR